MNVSSSIAWSTFLSLMLVQVLPMTCSCPSPCECNWVNGKYSLNCMERNLTTLPMSRDIADIVQTVVLDKNALDMTKFNFLTAGLGNVRKISMKFCNIGQLLGEVFSGLNNLHELDLSHNSLLFLTQQQFPSLPALRTLNLAYNSLRSIHKDSLANLVDRVERIDLSHNLLTSIPWTTFIHLTSLKQMWLGENPWSCDCQLGELHSVLTQRGILLSPAACSEPSVLSSRDWSTFQDSDFTCGPSVTLSPPVQHTVLPGEVVSLHCQVTGNPTPSVTWMQNMIPITRTNNQFYSIVDSKSGFGHSTSISSKLTIRNISSASLGKYSCLSKNSIDMDQDEVNLIFLESGGQVGEKNKDGYLVTIPICASLAVILIIMCFILLCCVKKYKGRKSDGHSSSLTILEYEKKLQNTPKWSNFTKEDNLKASWMTHVPRTPRPHSADQISWEDMPGTLSRCSTRHTYLPDSSEVDYWSTVEHSIANIARSRASIGTITTIADPIYGCVRRTNYPQHTHNPAVATLWHHRPGYVTMPRRPKASQPQAPPLDSLGPRTSADGCSHSNMNTLPLSNTTFHHDQATSSIVPPYSPPPPSSITAINTIGLPAVETVTETGVVTSSSPGAESSHVASKACLDTIHEQE